MSKATDVTKLFKVEEVKKYSLKELKAMDTISSSQADDLKFDDGKNRVWLARTGKADGEPYDNKVTVEQLKGGKWVEVDQYEAK